MWSEECGVRRALRNFSLFTFHLSLLVSLFSCQTDAYHIQGYARQLEQSDTICIVLENEPERMLGKAIVKDGKFSVTGHTDTILFCKAYLNRMKNCCVDFMLEPGNITLELNLPPKPSRTSGTKLNNQWQQLNDSIQRMGTKLINLVVSAKTPADEVTHQARLQAIDSLHRRMSDCIVNTARRNADNPLGQYIEKNYKAPEFK